MINARELRIGNYVQSKSLSIPKLNISHDGVMLVTGHGISFIESDINNNMEVEPIPLTEEWLLKFDFERESDGGSEYWSIQIGNNLHLTVSLADNTAGIDLNWRSQGSQIWMMIKHIHTLQNVYYSLTGEELEVNNE